MYTRILVPLENSPADQTILRHVTGLAKLSGAEVILLGAPTRTAQRA